MRWRTTRLLSIPSSSSVAPLDLGPLLAASARVALDALPWLAGAACCATLRVALQRSHPERTSEAAPERRARARLVRLLARAGDLSTSALVFEVACRVLFTAQLLRGVARERQAIGWSEVAITVLVAIPALLIVCDALATALALRRGDALLSAVLPTFERLQAPVGWTVHALEGIRRVVRRMVGLDADPGTAARIVEGLREVIEESEISRDLDATEREIIGNVMEFRDVNVAAVMTPRTRIRGVEAGQGLLAAARAVGESGHSRIPVFEGSLDSIVGIVTARDVLQAASEGGLEAGALRPWLRPAYFVPETKLVSDLLAELRREKTKLAIVLDEYGGTAGLVTLGDLLRELVGDIHPETDAPRAPVVRRRADGSVEVDAMLHVSEANEELGLDLPEDQDYETLAGFVLAELGRFPRRGETFRAHGRDITVLDATDRRVLKLLVRPRGESRPAGANPLESPVTLDEGRPAR